MTLHELIEQLEKQHEQAQPVGWPTLIENETLNAILFYLDILSLRMEQDEHT